MDAEIFRAADAIVCVSRPLKNWVVAHGVEERKVHVIPNAVSASLFAREPVDGAVRSRFGLEGKRVVGYLGSFQPWHDVGGLVRAFAALHERDPDLRLLLVGAGNREADARARAAELGAHDSVVFTGNVPHESVPEYLAAMDVAAITYRREGEFYFSPLKLFECMAAGRPTVAASVGQISEVVEHGRTGWLYPAGDIERLAEGLETLLYDPQAAASLGAAARRRVLAEHTWEATARRVTSLV
jgi:glycosyltransferase involved in cell wall biosynthesis